MLKSNSAKDHAVHTRSAPVTLPRLSRHVRTVRFADQIKKMDDETPSSDDRSVDIAPAYPMDFELPPPPSQIPNDQFFVSKAPLIDELSGQYASHKTKDNKDSSFGAFQQSVFALLSHTAVESIRTDRDQLLALGRSARIMVRFFMDGRLPDNGKFPAAQAGTATPASSAAPVAQVDPAVPAAGASTGLAPQPPRESLLRRAATTLRSGIKRRSIPSSSSEGSQTKTPKKPKTNIEMNNSTEEELAKRVKAVADQAKQRDGRMCVFTGSQGGIEAAHILPHAMNKNEDKISFFLALIPMLITMFGSAFAERLRILLGAVRSSEATWNVLTLNVYLHRLFDAGLVGFRPTRISTARVPGATLFRVHFAVHWLGKTKINLAKSIETPITDALIAMLELQEDYRANRNRYDIFDVITGTRILDGTETIIAHATLENAQRMYDCLAMSWAIRMILFLAGGAGVLDDDLGNDDYYEPLRTTVPTGVMDPLFYEAPDEPSSSRRSRRHNSSDNSASTGNRSRQNNRSDNSASTSTRFRPPSLSDAVRPITSSFFRTLRGDRSSAEDGQGTSVFSSESQATLATSHSGPSQSRAGKASAAGQTAVAGTQTEFASDPANIIPELGEPESGVTVVGRLLEGLTIAQQQDEEVAENLATSSKQETN